jgi:hypothetical protein
VIVLDQLIEAQKRAYIIADNQLALLAFEDDARARLLAAQDSADGLLVGDGTRCEHVARLMAGAADLEFSLLPAPKARCIRASLRRIFRLLASA